MNTEKKLFPVLRFPKFVRNTEWICTTLKAEMDYENGVAHENDIDTFGKYIVVNSKFISTEGLIEKRSNSARCLANEKDILMVLSDLPNGKAIAKCFYVDASNKYTVNQRICKLRSKGANSKLLYYIINRNPYFLSFDDGVKQTNLKKEEVLNCPLILPKSIEEQSVIAECLSSIDSYICSVNEKVEQFKAHKKSLLQKLFPQNGKNVPDYRFPEFEKNGAWGEKCFGDCLDYEQPQQYLVSSDNYKKEGTPVLTAGKTFVLGFTDESYGIYRQLPVIIFDDFTTASRYVNFPFKAKSSAMKMLQNKDGYDLKFMFEALQNYKYEPKEHQRHWISIFQNFKTLVPSYSEQRKIAECLFSIDKIIEYYSEKASQLVQHKKGIMQQLFPINR